MASKDKLSQKTIEAIFSTLQKENIGNFYVPEITAPAGHDHTKSDKQGEEIVKTYVYSVSLRSNYSEPKSYHLRRRDTSLSEEVLDTAFTRTRLIKGIEARNRKVISAWKLFSRRVGLMLVFGDTLECIFWLETSFPKLLAMLDIHDDKLDALRLVRPTDQEKAVIVAASLAIAVSSARTPRQSFSAPVSVEGSPVGSSSAFRHALKAAISGVQSPRGGAARSSAFAVVSQTASESDPLTADTVEAVFGALERLNDDTFELPPAIDSDKLSKCDRNSTDQLGGRVLFTYLYWISMCQDRQESDEFHLRRLACLLSGRLLGKAFPAALFAANGVAGLDGETTSALQHIKRRVGLLFFGGKFAEFLPWLLKTFPKLLVALDKVDKNVGAVRRHSLLTAEESLLTGPSNTSFGNADLRAPASLEYANEQQYLTSNDVQSDDEAPPVARERSPNVSSSDAPFSISGVHQGPDSPPRTALDDVPLVLRTYDQATESSQRAVRPVSSTSRPSGSMRPILSQPTIAGRSLPGLKSTDLLTLRRPSLDPARSVRCQCRSVLSNSYLDLYFSRGIIDVCQQMNLNTRARSTAQHDGAAASSTASASAPSPTVSPAIRQHALSKREDVASNLSLSSQKVVPALRIPTGKTSHSGASQNTTTDPNSSSRRRSSGSSAASYASPTTSSAIKVLPSPATRARTISHKGPLSSQHATSPTNTSTQKAEKARMLAERRRRSSRQLPPLPFDKPPPPVQNYAPLRTQPPTTAGSGLRGSTRSNMPQPLIFFTNSRRRSSGTSFETGR